MIILTATTVASTISHEHTPLDTFSTQSKPALAFLASIIHLLQAALPRSDVTGDFRGDTKRPA